MRQDWLLPVISSNSLTLSLYIYICTYSFLSHVYASSITAGASRTGAMFVTFLLSSLLHELVMAIVSGKIRGYLFAMQMAQIPLIALGQVRLYLLFILPHDSLCRAFFAFNSVTDPTSTAPSQLWFVRFPLSNATKLSVTSSFGQVYWLDSLCSTLPTLPTDCLSLSLYPHAGTYHYLILTISTTPNKG